MFMARQRLREAPSPRAHGRAAKLVQQWSGCYHRSLALTGDDILLCKRFRAAQLSVVEQDILVALLLAHLSLIDDELDTCAEVFRFVGVTGTQAVQVQRTLFRNGPLAATGLVTLGDVTDEPRSRGISIDPFFADDVLDNQDSQTIGWPVSTEKELYERLTILNRVLEASVDEADGRRFRTHRRARKTFHQITFLWDGLMRTLSAHPDWKLGPFLSQEGALDNSEQKVLVLLLGRELGQLSDGEWFCTGQNLSRAACAGENNLAIFRPESRLIRNDLIQPCEGKHPLISDDAEDLGDTQFELTTKSLELMQIKRSRPRRRDGDSHLREGKLRMDQLVLSENVTRALTMAIAQARHSRVLMDEWGLAESFAYGRGVTLLFSGPPGVGKTAVSEAVARELGRPLLAIDYSQVQNCFVGQTEKNVVRMFTKARQAGAVLFWDEADAMFCDRDSAHYNWEVRDVNVLLQELEKFEGVCILATNRKVTLDAALERRISLKIEFERPNREMRLAIWRKLMPSKLPIAADVTIEDLADTDLTGGEIKNVILNASRSALARNQAGPVNMDDFRRAVRLEVGGRWCEHSRARAGFGAYRQSDGPSGSGALDKRRPQ
jgi:hypothetical protein